jgi:HSP20 family protein
MKLRGGRGRVRTRTGFDNLTEGVMANISRFDPFGSDINDLLNGLFVRPVRFGGDGNSEITMKIEVKQDDKVYSVTAEMPGVKKEDIHVQVDGNRVAIDAEVKQEQEEKKGERVVRSERYYGRLSRSFALEHEIDEAAVKAAYDDGLLKLTLPKKAKSAAKRIPVL